MSDHAYDRITDRGIVVSEIFDGVAAASVVEEYPNYHAGPCVLALQFEPSGAVVHALWGLRAGTDSPAVLVTAYRPDPQRWTQDFRRRI
ncbi:MAG: DUF4258 domain-containing protein [Hyphomicrobiaceae bacterium]